MHTAPQELLKEYVRNQNFASTAEILEAMKEMFRDVIQTVMEVELDQELGRKRCQWAAESEGRPNIFANGQKEPYTGGPAVPRTTAAGHRPLTPMVSLRGLIPAVRLASISRL